MHQILAEAKATRDQFEMQFTGTKTVLEERLAVGLAGIAVRILLFAAIYHLQNTEFPSCFLLHLG